MTQGPTSKDAERMLIRLIAHLIAHWPIVLGALAGWLAAFFLALDGLPKVVLIAVVAGMGWWAERLLYPAPAPVSQAAPTPAAGQAGKKRRTKEEILAELDALVGLVPVKQEVRRILALAEAQAVRRQMGLPPLVQSFHMAFTGNPGTGKTTVAKLIGELFGAVGLLPSGHLVVVGKADLVGQYVGHTAPRTRAVIQRALGGVLFIDEAYELADQGFGGEALTEVLVAMETYRDKLVVIVAGYRDVVDKLSKVNEGFRSRIGQIIEFPDYSAEELLEIARLAAKKQGFSLTPEASEALRGHFRQVEPQVGKLGNGRYARTCIERCISAAVTRDPTAVTITADDVEQGVGATKEKRRTPQEIWQEINSLVGLKPVKEYLREVEATVLADKQRREKGLPPLRQSLHMAFLGNPGTGKTTVARLVAELFAALGVLPSGHLVETDRSGLVAGYVGQTALKVREVVDRALGGVLFIDEAYSLARGGGGDFGGEALDALLKAMEDHRHDLVVILAGYTREMQELFKLNPGLESRIAFVVEFTDYSPEELLEIGRQEAGKCGFILRQEAEQTLLEHFKQIANQIGKFGNGRYARRVIEGAIRQAVKAGRTDIITAADVKHVLGEAHEKRRTVEDVWREINSLIGLKQVKEFLREVEATIVADKQRRQKGLPPLRQSLHMAFLGNPGTGKTTVARLVGELFAALGVLPSGHLVETDRSGLVAGYVGQTALKVRDVVDKALGGVLFVDEAYSLARGGQWDYGGEALDALVKAMEDYRNSLVVILAGYTQEMQNLFVLNPGLESRIAFMCEFPDYSPGELVQIAQLEAQKRGFDLESSAEEALLKHFTRVAEQIGELGNGRYARKLIEAAIRRAVRAGRVDAISADDIAAAVEASGSRI